MICQEFNKHDKEPAKYIKQWKGVKPKTGAPYTCDIGYERFLGPEVSFSNLFLYPFPWVSKLVQSLNPLGYVSLFNRLDRLFIACELDVIHCTCSNKEDHAV